MDPDSQGQPDHQPPAAPLVDSMTMDQRPRRTRRGNPVVAPDPGTPASRSTTLFAAILFAALAIVWQNMPADWQRQAVLGEEPVPVAPSPDTKARGSMFTEIYMRAYLKMNNAEEIRPAFSSDPTQTGIIVDTVDGFAESSADRVRTAMFAAELLGADAGLERIETARADLFKQQLDLATEQIDEEIKSVRDAAFELALEELDILEAVYTIGPDALDQAARDQLVARYGVFGEHTLTWGGEPESRTGVLGLPWLFILIVIAFAAIIGVAILAGFVLFIMGLVWFSKPQTRLHNPVPVPGGSVMLETYAWFVGAFFVYVVAATAVEYHAPGYALWTLPVQWLLMLIPLWPLLRGMRSRQWRLAMGLTRGQGVFREIGAGFVAYLASLPVFLVGVGITLVVVLTQMAIQASNSGGPPPPPPSNPIVDLIGSGNVMVIVFIVALATIWAPITEELVFRGALFRHLRARVIWPIAALVSAVLFAYMHSYGPLLVAPLIALGFMFAFMREWRGSIIAPITAHFLHNGTLMAMMVSVAYALS
ncbi:MAG: type II CAAX endopeptidase family protein [Planctomycetota bacterium]